VSQSETIATELTVLADGLDSSAQFLTQTAGTLRGLAKALQKQVQDTYGTNRHWTEPG
jgi:hypothetical protein